MTSTKNSVEKSQSPWALGAELKEYRLRNGLTQKQLASQLNVSTDYLSRLERADSAPSKALDQRIQVLLGRRGKLRRQLTLVVQQSFFRCALLDQDFNILAISPTAAAVQGRTQDELLGIKAQDLYGVAPTNLVRLRGVLDRMTTGEAGGRFIEHSLHNGKEYWSEVRVTKLTVDGEVLLWYEWRVLRGEPRDKLEVVTLFKD